MNPDTTCTETLQPTEQATLDAALREVQLRRFEKIFHTAVLGETLLHVDVYSEEAQARVQGVAA